MKDRIISFVFACIGGFFLGVGLNAAYTSAKASRLSSDLTWQHSNSTFQASSWKMNDLKARIEEIKWRHQMRCDTSRTAIQASYLACRLGIPMTNYIADLEKLWNELLAKQISEAEKN